MPLSRTAEAPEECLKPFGTIAHIHLIIKGWSQSPAVGQDHLHNREHGGEDHMIQSHMCVSWLGWRGNTLAGPQFPPLHNHSMDDPVLPPWGPVLMAMPRRPNE